MKILLPLFLFLFTSGLLMSVVEAEEQRIPLLAVVEGEGEEGVVAHLVLEIAPGTGKVLIGTTSFAEVDTQITTKQAKEVACSFLEERCDMYDFFYTIQANSQVVKGPSAGAATALLTFAAVNEVQLREDVAITGTILSGGIVGNVGGIPKKVKVAANNDKSKVLIPQGNLDEIVPGKEITLRAYGKQLGIEIIEVVDIIQAAEIMLGQPEIIIPTIKEAQDYSESIVLIASNLCELAEERRGKEEEADELLEKTEGGSDNAYARASYCFNANVITTEKELNEKTVQELTILAEELTTQFNDAEENLNTTSLEEVILYGAIIDRIEQGRRGVIAGQQQLEEGEKESGVTGLAFGRERIRSVDEWKRFLDENPKNTFSQEMLQPLCRKKIEQVSELLQYANILSESNRSSIEQLRTVREQEQEGNYALCVYFATEEKARAHYLLARTNGLEEHDESILDTKLGAAQYQIGRQAERGRFPIVAYTFFQYAEALKEDNETESALLFAEQAIEFGLLSNEITAIQEQQSTERVENIVFVVLSVGIIALLLMKIVYLHKRRKA